MVTGMRKIIIPILFVMAAGGSQAQPQPANGGGNSFSFIDYQRTLPRPSEALLRKEDTLRSQFKAKDLKWPAKYIYIRSFKYDSQLEVWVKNERNEPFRHFKTYKVCALAGTLGPKRMEGDYQVPEGFYFINEFNPRSNYYLSLGLNYPNASDRVLSDSERPGSAIFIHGSCVTVGCIPIRDEQIDELYILAAHAKDQGQDYIPVHIFPIRFNVDKSVKYFEKLAKNDPSLKSFAAPLEDAFDYFDKHKQLPVVMIGDRGEYIINDAPPRKLIRITDEKPARRPATPRITREIKNIPEAVHQWPTFPGGIEAFNSYLSSLGNELTSFLPRGLSKAYVQVEFIIDSDGTPVNFKVLRSVKDGDDLNEELLYRMERMEKWKPALLHEKPVPKKMVQTVTIETNTQ
jgi:murein L,D-transpeptidase YafK